MGSGITKYLYGFLMAAVAIISTAVYRSDKKSDIDLARTVDPEDMKIKPSRPYEDYNTILQDSMGARYDRYSKELLLERNRKIKVVK